MTVKPYRLNTITRVELAAILVALRKCRNSHNEIIAHVCTDSKCSMDKIAKNIKNPMLTTNDCDEPMVQEIVTLLVARATAGLHTTLMKVKSHIGMKGNEKAAFLANKAATEGAPDIDVSNELLENFEGKYWPKQKVKLHKRKRISKVEEW